jgi:hypothetical protein
MIRSQASAMFKRILKDLLFFTCLVSGSVVVLVPVGLLLPKTWWGSYIFGMTFLLPAWILCRWDWGWRSMWDRPSGSMPANGDDDDGSELEPDQA